jgi:hypothetical protein
MNCAYHSINVAVVNCNGCSKPLCPACDHRIKGFPFCQDCIVAGVDMLRSGGNSASYVPLVKKHTSPIFAILLSFICPGLGAAYNGQTTKAIVYFATFIGLFQMAILTPGGGKAFFVLGFIGMWFFAALDAWKTARLIRAGVTPDGAQNIITERLTGNLRLWGLVLLVVGTLLFLQMFVHVGHLLRSVLPVLIIALGVYVLSGFTFKRKTEKLWTNSERKSLNETSFRAGNDDLRDDYQSQSSAKSWKSRY